MSDSTYAPPAPLSARELMREWRLAIPVGLSVRAAGGLLDAAGADAAPVVDSSGRCVGLFTAADYRQWLGSDGPDEVRHHMTRRFAVATPEAGPHELLHRLNAYRDANAEYLADLRREGKFSNAWVDTLLEAGGCPVEGNPPIPVKADAGPR